MTSKIILKKSSVAAKIPGVNDLDYGELALNYTDGKLYYKNSSNNIEYIANGSISEVILTTSTTTTLSTSTTFVLASGEITLTLPSAIGIPSKKYNIRNSGVNSITVVPAVGQTINGYTSMTITETNSVMSLLSDGSNWIIF